MDEWLDQCRRRFGPAPRRISFWAEWTYLSIPRPAACVPTHKLSYFFGNRKAMLRDGWITW
ncbi:MAG TPA: hypothetical protein VFJ30_08775, partial [Phycisphaerae bacterium]|nr:hypothetical protein [Phycisphaerae bacterium]